VRVVCAGSVTDGRRNCGRERLMKSAGSQSHSSKRYNPKCFDMYNGSFDTGVIMSSLGLAIVCRTGVRM